MIWSILGSSLFATFVGVGLTLCWIIVHTPNPASIPMRKFVFRSIPGLVLYLIVWVIFSQLAFLLIRRQFEWASVFEGSERWLLAASVGIIIPQTRRLKKLLVSKALLGIRSNVVKVLQQFDESSALYMGRIINREERKAGLEVIAEGNDHPCLIDGLFEFHRFHIVESQASRMDDGGAQRAIGIFYVNSIEIKIKYLLRHLGYRNMRKTLQVLRQSPEILSPVWPIGTRDRRRGSERRSFPKLELRREGERRSQPWGRRRSDSPYMRHLALSGPDGPPNGGSLVTPQIDTAASNSENRELLGK